MSSGQVILLTTGFKAYTGALEAFPIIGSSGRTLNEKLGTVSGSIMRVCVAAFPNMFMATGPQAPVANLPISIEQNVIWITACIRKLEHEGWKTFLPKADVEAAGPSRPPTSTRRRS